MILNIEISESFLIDLSLFRLTRRVAMVDESGSTSVAHISKQVDEIYGRRSVIWFLRY